MRLEGEDAATNDFAALVRLEFKEGLLYFGETHRHVSSVRGGQQAAEGARHDGAGER